MSVGDQDRRIAYSIVKHLRSQAEAVLGEDGKEEVEVAVQCICEAYGISTEKESDVKKYEIKPTLEELFSDLPLEGELSEEDKKKAEGFKQHGNISLKNEKYSEAVESYTKAIELDGDNSTYYCNRAAAYIKLEQLDKGIEDCKKALLLNPSYARAHGRLGYMYSSLSRFEESKECFERALQLDPENESYRSNLQTVEEQLRPPPIPSLGAAMGGAEGGANPLGGLLGMVQNPGFMNMAANIMQTPAFQNMASQMISRGGPLPTNMADIPPDMMSSVTQAARDMQQNNPDVFQNIQQQVFQGLQQQPQQQQQQQQPGSNQQQEGGGGENPGTDKT